MKTLRTIMAVVLSFTLAMARSTSVLAADSGSWNFAATPAYTEIPKTIRLDYSSDGYIAKITSKSGGSAMNAVVIESDCYSPNKVAEISEVGVPVDIGHPSCDKGIVKFKVTLRWQSGKTAYNKGTIVRK